MAALYGMEPISQTDIDGTSETHDDRIQFDVIIDKFLPASLIEFKTLKNNFSLAVKEIVDFMITKVTISPSEGYAALNAPVNLIAVGNCRKNLDLLKTFMQATPNSPIPVKLKMFYNNKNDTFYGPLTVVKILNIYEEFCFDLIKGQKFQEIEDNEPQIDDTEDTVLDQTHRDEREKRVQDAKDAFKTSQTQPLRHYISNKMCPFAKKVADAEAPRPSPSTTDLSAQPTRRRRRAL